MSWTTGGSDWWFAPCAGGAGGGRSTWRAPPASQPVVSRLERGHLTSLSVETVRRLLAALDIRGELDLRWRGGELDRLLDDGHSRLAALAAAHVRARGWQVLSEVTFSRYGERGSIDLIGVKEKLHAAIVQEVKTELTSYEETMRRLDAKGRVAATVIEERLGWRPGHVAVVLVLADTSANRARVHRVAPLLRAALPARNVEIRRWLRSPSGPLRGVWFIRDIRARTAKCSTGGSHRVRRPRNRAA